MGAIARTMAPSGALTITTNVRKAPLSWRLRNLVFNRMRDWPRLAMAHLAQLCGVPVMLSALYLRVKKLDGTIIDYGLVGTRVVTNAGVAFIVDAWQNSVELENMKYHGIGTGTTAEAAADTALVTESTTALNPASTRATGSLAEGATANIFRTVGSLTASAQIVAREHGVFNQAATGGGTILDRTVFATVTIESGESITMTYDLTLTSGS